MDHLLLGMWDLFAEEDIIMSIKSTQRHFQQNSRAMGRVS